jgi:hypothetical protein
MEDLAVSPIDLCVLISQRRKGQNYSKGSLEWKPTKASIFCDCRKKSNAIASQAQWTIGAALDGIRVFLNPPLKKSPWAQEPGGVDHRFGHSEAPTET